MSNKDEQKQGIIFTSNARQEKYDSNHKCQHFFAFTKNSKNIIRKNREIETLNKIITNLKNDIEKLQANKEKEQTQLSRCKQQAEQSKMKMNQLQLKCLEYQRQLAEERLQHASQLKKYSIGKQTRNRKNYYNQYYSQCQFSRNTDHESPLGQLNRHTPSYKVANDYPINKKEDLNMGEMFMGKKGKLNDGNQLSRASSWSKIQLLNQENQFTRNNFLRNSNKFAFVDVRKITFESALQYLRKQNENLKTSIF